MLKLLFPKWFPEKEAEQLEKRNTRKEYIDAERELQHMRFRLELKRYKDCDMEALAQALYTLHIIDTSHTENITLIPEGIKMTYRYYNSESQSNAFMAMLHGFNYDEKIYGKRKTPKVLFFIGDDVAILPALKIAVAEYIRQHNEYEAKQ
jgi:hypothetical protein